MRGVPLVTVVLVRWLFGTPRSAFHPILSDEIDSWHEAWTFASAGLRGGYYTLGEILNASGFTPFGPHGPGYVTIYSRVGVFTGWLPRELLANPVLVVHRHAETFHHAGPIAMAALCARALSSRPSPWLAATGVAVLCVLSFARPTWIILIPIAVPAGIGISVARESDQMPHIPYSPLPRR